MTEQIMEIKDKINETADMIQSQLQGVDSSLLGAFVTIITSALVSKTLGMIEYWTTASFVLMWVILLNSFIKSYLPWMQKQKRQEMITKTQVTMNLLKESPFERWIYLFTITVKNSVPLFRSIGIMFFISFITLVIYVNGNISKIVPIIASLLFMSLPLMVQGVLQKIERIDLKIAFSRITCIGWLSIFLFVLIFAASIFVLPIWSLVSLFSLYTLSWSTVGSFLIVIVLQAVTALVFINYFSACVVQKEMTIALFNLSTILNRINKITLNESIDNETYEELRNSYIKAKRYEMIADDSLIVNFYSLATNQTYLSSIVPQKTKDENFKQKQTE